MAIFPLLGLTFFLKNVVKIKGVHYSRVNMVFSASSKFLLEK